MGSDEDRARLEGLRASQYAWSRALWERIEFLLRDGSRDPSAVARQAWAECAARHPALRRMLDEHRDELTRAA